MSISGELSFLKDGIQISKLHNREGHLFPNIELSSKWSELEKIEYFPLNRMLRLDSKQESISIFGASAKLAHYIFELHKKEEYIYETISMFRMYKGALLTIEGFLFLGSKNTHFLPISQLEDLLGQPILSHPNQDLCKVFVHGLKQTLITLKFPKKNGRLKC